MRNLLTDYGKKNYHNTITKTYLNGAKQVLVATKPIFSEKVEQGCVSFGCCINTDSETGQNLVNDGLEGWKMLTDAMTKNLPEIVEMSVWRLEELNDLDELDRRRKKEHADRAMRRARAKVRDYCLATPMAWFVTLTLDQAKVDRYDVDKMTRKLNRWLRDMVRDHPGLGYVMVPELHKDGAIHYHALMTDHIEATDSGTIIPGRGDKPRRPVNENQRKAWIQQGGRVVYNLPEWPYGFTTAVKLVGDSYENAVNYVAKYITKGHNPGRATNKVGGRWYYHGGALGTPGVEYSDSDYVGVRDAAGAAGYEIDLERQMSGLRLLVIWVEPDGTLRIKRR